MRAEPRAVYILTLLGGCAVLGSGLVVALPASTPHAAPGLSAALPAREQLPPRIWKGADGELLPFADDDELLTFLRNARMSDPVELNEGVTKPLRVTLEHDGIVARGIFRNVDEQQMFARYASERGEMFFRDRGVFECAAYQLARLLGVDHVPPVVERTFQRRGGSLQIWIEDSMTDGERIRQGLADPARHRWSRQLNTMNVFDALVGNIDRNRGNMLIDEYWRVWFIDHTRAFRGSVPIPENLASIERRFWHGLRTVEPADIESRLGAFLTAREMRGLLDRRSRLIEHYERLIRDRGEDRVVFDY